MRSPLPHFFGIYALAITALLRTEPQAPVLESSKLFLNLRSYLSNHSSPYGSLFHRYKQILGHNVPKTAAEMFGRGIIEGGV